MPIVSADKFQYFQPQGGMPSNVQGRMIVPSAPSVPAQPASMGASMILKVGDAIEKMGQVIEEARVKDDVQRYTLGAISDLSQAEQEVMSQGSHRDMMSRFQDRLDEINQKYAEQIGQDREVARGFGEKFGLLSAQHTDRVRTQSWRRELDQQQASAIESAGRALNLVGQSRSMIEVRLHMDDYLQNLDYKAQNGLVDASWAASQAELFKARAGSMLVEQDIFVNPAAAIQKLTQEDLANTYPGLPEEKRIDYLRIARQQIEQQQRQILEDKNRREREDEKAKRDLQEKNYGDALVSYSKGELTEPMVQDLISRRDIDPDKGGALITRLRTEERREENDPVTVGSIAERMETGQDVSRDLDEAYRSGKVKTETYVSLRKQQGDISYKRGLSYVNSALKPSEADKWTPDKHIRHAEAVDEYSTRVASGEDPMAVGRDIVGRYMGDVRRTARGIPRPKFLKGDKMDLQALEQAQEKTTQAFRDGNIDAQEFDREARSLKLLLDLATKARSDSEELSSEELKERDKKVRKGAKK